MPDTSVKYFHSGMTGASVLNGTAGSLIAVLDSCLVNGFGLVTLDSLVIASGVATATRSGGHPFEPNTVATIASATVSGGTINGEHKVISTTATTFTFDATGIADQTATGTITAKLSAAGWAKQYSGTNKAAYKPTDVTATGCLLRVDDTGTVNARVVGYETMSDVDTGTGPFPTAAQVSGGNYWPKAGSTSATAINWMLFADSKMFYLCVAHRTVAGPSPNDYGVVVFGDFNSTKSSDAYGCVISGLTSDVTNTVPTNASNYWQGVNSVGAGLYIARSYTGLGSSINVLKGFPQPTMASTNAASGSASNSLGYPNSPDGGLYVVPHYLSESAAILRGISPGFYCSPQSIPTGTFAPRDNVVGVTGLTGKTLKAITVTTSTIVTAFVDVTGPWR